MIPSGRRVGEGTHQRVPSPTFRVMTPTVVGKTGAAYLRLPQTTGSSPLAWGTIATGTDTRVIPTVVGKMGKVFPPPTLALGSSPLAWGKLLGLWPVKVTVLMVAHPCLGWGCLAAEGLVGCRFLGAVPGRPPNPHRPGNPYRTQDGSKGKRRRFGRLSCSQDRGQVHGRETNKHPSHKNNWCKCFSACRYQRQALTMSRVGLVLATALAIMPDPAASRNHQLALPCRVW